MSAKAAEKVPYRLKLSKERSYDIRFVSDSNGAGQSEDDGQKYDFQQSTGFGYRFDVNSVDDQGNALVNCKVNWAKDSQARMLRRLMNREKTLETAAPRWVPLTCRFPVTANGALCGQVPARQWSGLSFGTAP